MICIIPLPPSLPLSISPSFRPHPAVMLWTTDDVCQWMKEIGMEEYTDCMKSHDVGGAKLISLQTSDLTVSVIILQQQSAIMYLISSVCVWCVYVCVSDTTCTAEGATACTLSHDIIQLFTSRLLVLPRLVHKPDWSMPYKCSLPLAHHLQVTDLS